MQRRTLGRTGLEVSEIGFGAWQLGNQSDWARMDDRTAHRLVDAAIDGGINLFDTAPNYAGTHSERLLGEALESRRDQVVLVSKFGHPPQGTKDFSVHRFWDSLEATLRRLRTDHLDVLLLHNPDAAMYQGTDPLWEALDMAKQKGLLRFYGASLDFADEIKSCVHNTGSDVLEILFNIFHQDVRRAFDHVRDANVGTIVKVPLDSGWLTGRFGPDSQFEDIRSRWSKADIARRAELVSRIDWLTADGVPMCQHALGYVLSYREVSCVIPGIRTMDQLQSNLAAAGRRLATEDRERLEAFWEEITRGGKDLLCW